MKKLLLILLLNISFTGISQEILLHCGKIIDTKQGKVLSNKTIVVSDSKIIRVEDGFSSPKQVDTVCI